VETSVARCLRTPKHYAARAKFSCANELSFAVSYIDLCRGHTIVLLSLIPISRYYSPPSKRLTQCTDIGLETFGCAPGQMGSDSITYCPHCEGVCIPPWVSSVLMVEAGGFAPPSCLVFSLDYQTIFLFIPFLFFTNTFYFVLWNNLVCTFVISDCHCVVF